MTRVAAYDCGTNSLRVLVADLDPDTGRATELLREMRIVRLGQGVDASGRIAEEAVDRVLAGLEELVALAAPLEPQVVRFCATSAARDAENAADLLGAIRQRVGVEPEVLDGDAEAAAGFAGAVRELPALPDPVLVLDIGGGSTELVLGRAAGEVEVAHSLDVGSMRLTERFLHDDPPTPDQVARARRAVDEALDGCRVDPAAAATVVGVAGTVTTLAAAVLDLEAYRRDRIHHSVLAVDDVRHQAERLLAMSVAERRRLGFMHPGRADVIGAGGVVLERILARAQVRSVLVSEHDILDGIAWSLVPPPTP